MKFDDRILNFEHKLNDTDDTITEFIQKNRNDFPKLTIRVLAEKLYTVPNTIVRYSQKLGYSGFSELKNAIKIENNIEYPIEHAPQWEVIKRTFDLINHELEEKITKQIMLSKKVVFFAVGQTSYPTEIYAKNFQALDHKSTFHTYQHEVFYELETEKNLFLILVSLSGESPQLIKIAEKAREKNCSLLGVTHLSNNSLQKVCDYHLYCYSPEKYLNGYNITDKTPLLIVLNSLFEAYQKMCTNTQKLLD
ncbi:MurR/RpiR family transcriptional regulator [Enterococcus rivorum]|uniref:RpiR family transcriptional regulator n=1 Tax=Enterococcus rivorum TaxID=762845 RepID=A0A1E5L1E4_9ENTE|nr:MurR/RpiR family transcriptional regulator [Enterococcus rivorum]MBP2098654.1 DNA-binding MurR/RpiR family transcriptional regulator [Enterococcus rivorum]OEH83749.1 hypothetical protein BCR26_07960 [Enterococcus rivorum]